MEYTKGELRVEITSIVKSHTLCEDGEALGASGNIIEIPIIKAALKALAKAEQKWEGVC